MGELDNTLIIYISGDNGTSPEGTLLGTPNQYASFNGILDIPVAENLYVDALIRDPVLAVMVKELLDSGRIDWATALLAWQTIECQSPECRHHSA